MPDKFVTTRWSLIVAASRDDPHARDALQDLCEAYWRPVYAYMRRHGRVPDEAADLTQAFFVQLLEHRGFARADRAKGRFRAYLLTAARNFLLNAQQHDLASKRGGRVAHLAIDIAEAERALAHEPADAASSPHAVFERQWAVLLVERTLDGLRTEYTSRGQQSLFEDLQPFLTSNPVADTPMADRAMKHGMTADARRMAIHRLRRRFGERLRAEIAETLDDRGEVDGELRHVLHILSA
jgi:DNA-directed RNA polymerase specialized sigma24 family protein